MRRTVWARNPLSGRHRAAHLFIAS